MDANGSRFWSLQAAAHWPTLGQGGGHVRWQADCSALSLASERELEPPSDIAASRSAALLALNEVPRALDAQGVVWAGTQRGVARIDEQHRVLAVSAGLALVEEPERHRQGDGVEHVRADRDDAVHGAGFNQPAADFPLTAARVARAVRHDAPRSAGLVEGGVKEVDPQRVGVVHRRQAERIAGIGLAGGGEKDLLAQLLEQRLPHGFRELLDLQRQRGRREVQFFGRTREAVVARHGQEDAQLVQGGVAQVHSGRRN